MKKILVVLRHQNSLQIVENFLNEKGMYGIYVVLDPVELPELTAFALKTIESAIASGVDAVVIGTKVYDDIKQEKTDPPLRLIEFLELLQTYGIGKTPICMTHLAVIPHDLIRKIRNLGMNIGFVENDNLKSDGMKNLGPLILGI